MKAIIQRILFNISYFIYWLFYFFILRSLFLLYYFDKTKELDFNNLIVLPLYSLQLDLSTAAYLSALAFLFICISVFLKNKWTYQILKYYTLNILIIVNLLALFDLALYKPWGIRLDSTPIMYLNTPMEMLASVTNIQLILGFIAWILLNFSFFILFKRLFKNKLLNLSKSKFYHSFLLILFVPLLILPIRGGLQTVPINLSSVYYSNQMFANHAAVNFAWSFMDSMSKRDYDTNNPYIKFDKNIADRIIQSANNKIIQQDSTAKPSLLNTKRPHILLIIWESLTAKIVAPLGGESDVTSNFNALTKEGILFTNFYANGDRSDKGLVAILSGYYPQTDKSIIKITNKIRSLPMLPQTLKNVGYQSQFYYGGDLNFGNMNSYLRTAAINDFVDGDQFDKKDWNTKWGAHDHVVLNQFIKDHKNNNRQAFFDIIFTLSSHEPFEFPSSYKSDKKWSEKNTEDNRFRSAHAYTDQAIGDFIKQAKQQKWWDNTLIVIMADHGHHRPEQADVFNAPSKFHIPMLWLGGALATKDTTISNIGSQIDFSKTLLQLLNIPSDEYVWSNDLLIYSENHYAHYIFNKGFGTLNNKGKVVFDYNSDDYLIREGNTTNFLDSLGKAITQASYQDFLERK